MPDREAKKKVSPSHKISQEAEQKKSPVLWRDTGLIIFVWPPITEATNDGISTSANHTCQPFARVDARVYRYALRRR